MRGSLALQLLQRNISAICNVRSGILGSENTDGKLPTSAPNARSRQGDTQEVGMARLQRRLLSSCAAVHQRESHNAFMSGSVQSSSASELPFYPAWMFNNQEMDCFITVFYRIALDSQG